MLAFFEDFGATLENTKQKPRASPVQGMTDAEHVQSIKSLLAFLDEEDAYEQFVTDSKVSSARFGQQAGFMHNTDLMLGPQKCPHCKKSVPMSSKCTSPEFGGIYHQDLIDIGSGATRA